MNTQKMILVIWVSVLLFSSTTLVVASDDFDWIQNLNARALADPSSFRASLSARFHIGDAEISAVLNDVANPADAYILFRLGEMSSKSTDYVMGKYKHEKNHGWGALAKSLGIKPGSKEFHQLKRGPDIEHSSGKSNSGKKLKSKNKGKG